MHVAAFAPSTGLALKDDGGVLADGFPMSKAYVESFPTPATIPMVLAAYAQAGGDYDPRHYIAVTSPGGERLTVLECSWHWPDTPGEPVKYQVLTRFLQLELRSAGIYTIGLYDDPHATESDHLFPLPVALRNPLLPRPPQASIPKY